MNSTKGVKNIIWGIFAQIITIAAGVVIPRLTIVNLGSESNGLLNSVGSVLAYLNLLEAGVGTVTVQALFRPLAEDDRDAINRILAATHHFYKRTGRIYLACVLVLSCGYTAFAHTELPHVSVFLVVLTSGLSGVLSYFFQGKYRLFLTAEGKGYVLTNLSTVTSVGVSIAKVLVLLSGGNVVSVQLIGFSFNLAQMVFFLAYMRRNYAWIDLTVTPDFEAISQKNAVLVGQIASLVFYNTDVVILTLLTSLKVVSVYSMYAMIFGMVKAIAVTFSDSVVFAIGQAYRDRQKFNQMINAYEVYNLSMTFSLFCITGILILPFLRLYTKGITDINYLDRYVAALFVVYYLMDNGRKSSGIVINIAQHFEQTKWRAVLEAAINLTSSVVLTVFFGIYGVLLGTIIALLYRANDMILYASRLLERSPLITYRRWLRNVLIFGAAYWLAARIPWNLNDYGQMFACGVVLCVTIIPVFLAINSLWERESAQYAYNAIRDVLHRKLKR